MLPGPATRPSDGVCIGKTASPDVVLGQPHASDDKQERHEPAQKEPHPNEERNQEQPQQAGDQHPGPPARGFLYVRHLQPTSYIALPHASRCWGVIVPRFDRCERLSIPCSLPPKLNVTRRTANCKHRSTYAPSSEANVSPDMRCPDLVFLRWFRLVGSRLEGVF